MLCCRRVLRASGDSLQFTYTEVDWCSIFTLHLDPSAGLSRPVCRLSCWQQHSVNNNRSSYIYIIFSGFGGLEVACWPLVPRFVGSNPVEAIGFFRAKKSSARLPSEREVKPFAPCRIFAACKRTWKCMRGSRSFWSKLPAISHRSSSSFHY